MSCWRSVHWSFGQGGTVLSRALPCGRRRPPGAAGGGTAAGVSEGLGFSLVLIQPSACVLAAGLSGAVGGASLLW